MFKIIYLPNAIMWPQTFDSDTTANKKIDDLMHFYSVLKPDIKRYMFEVIEVSDV